MIEILVLFVCIIIELFGFFGSDFYSEFWFYLMLGVCPMIK